MDGETQWRAGLVVAVRNRKLKANYGNEALLNCSACGPAGPQLPISNFGNRIRDRVENPELSADKLAG
ncbi:unnamed protein product [Clonostachys rosea f. rosea IK726]|uniref:Uncharacterized protein n=1 Tax=Clonostachys rosea f. rosea IK726 TaxID=1349383 RepID=A0ACA9TFZ3_BIOOC|nr:unnamed protein product [Clonostachys rosea f. rosea IK726]